MKRFGFTLVEILVSISVIVLLMAIILPTLSLARQNARRTACQAKIRELGLKLHLYNTENGTLPPGFYKTFLISERQKFLLSPFDRRAIWWPWYIDTVPYQLIPDYSLLQCPANRLMPIFKNYPLYGNYGVNWSLCRSPNINSDYSEFRGQPLSLDSLKTPGQILLLVDSGYSLIAWQHTLPEHLQSIGGNDDDPLKNAYLPGATVNSGKNIFPIPPDDTEDAINGRHPNKTVNVAYADGHVVAEKAADLVVQPLEAEGEFANLSPLWKP